MTEREIQASMQAHRDAQHAVLMAVQRALTDDETAAFMDSAIRRWPLFEAEGVTPADVLDYTVSYDEFLAQTEPFYEALPADSPVPGEYGTIVALHALILLDRPLTAESAVSLLSRAGLTAADS
jgi:hypothetical protein